uniref:SGNH hydrolase-type esterase domain-containing protein n=1 Tax=Callorhinchus milii TaxID=7868 RepID=A0A4W3J7M1_CALMI
VSLPTIVQINRSFIPWAVCRIHIVAWILSALQLRIAELESQVQTLHSIRDSERFLDSMVEETLTPLGLSYSSPALYRSHERGVLELSGGQSSRKGPLPEEPNTQPPFIHAKSDWVTVRRSKKRACSRQSTPNRSLCEDIVIGDSTVRGTDRIFCNQNREARIVCCLPGARVVDFTERMDKILRGEGECPEIVVHVGTHDTGKKRAPGRVSKAGEQTQVQNIQGGDLWVTPGTSGANWYRQKKIIDLNAGLKEWCGEQEFQFMGHWHEYWGRWELFQRNGLHLNRAGTNVLATRINREVERTIF